MRRARPTPRATAPGPVAIPRGTTGGAAVLPVTDLVPPSPHPPDLHVTENRGGPVAQETLSGGVEAIACRIGNAVKRWVHEAPA